MGIWIAGAGGFGRETLDALLADGPGAGGFVDDRLAGSEVRGLEVRHPDEAPMGEEFVVGIADPQARRNMVSRLSARGLSPVTVVHPRAIIGPETTLGPGCVVLGGAHVSSSVTLGAHVQINYNATVGHDAVLDDYVTVYPGANVGGAVHLEEAVMVGSNACVLQERRIGAAAFVGAGAVVTRNVDDAQVVVGVPARPQRSQGSPQ